MKAGTDNQVLYSASKTEIFCEEQNKIELLSCPNGKTTCKELLLVINKNFVIAHQAFIDKDFNRSIDLLKNTYYKTAELTDAQCQKCANLFRSTINDSLKDIHIDLNKMASGLFGKKSYRPICNKALNVLTEFDKAKINGSLQKERFNTTYIKSPLRKVS